MELTTKEKDLNKIGSLAGTCIGTVPFYTLYKIIRSLEVTFKVSKSLFVKLLVSLSVMPIIVKYIYDSLSKENDVNLIYIDPNFFLLSISILILIILIIYISVFTYVGISIKSFLYNNKLESDDVRFELAKLSGVYLRNIPFYKIIQLIKLKELVKSYEGSKITFMPYYICMILLFIVSMPFKLFIFLFVLVISAALGFQLIELKNVIIDKNTEGEVENIK